MPNEAIVKAPSPSDRAVNFLNFKSAITHLQRRLGTSAQDYFLYDSLCPKSEVDMKFFRDRNRCIPVIAGIKMASRIGLETIIKPHAIQLHLHLLPTYQENLPTLASSSSAAQGRLCGYRLGHLHHGQHELVGLQ